MHEVPGPDGKLVPAVEFTSTADTQFRSELNLWYPTLNGGVVSAWEKPRENGCR